MENAPQPNTGGGFAKSTNFKWLAAGIFVFILIVYLIPVPESVVEKVKDLFPGSTSVELDQKTFHLMVILGLLGACVVFFATEAIPMPAVALSIGLVQLFYGVTPPARIVSTYAHDAVWFIAGSLAIGATLVKYGIDKRIGILVVKLSGAKTRRIVLGMLLGTAIPSAFINEASIAPMFIPIAIALTTLAGKKGPSANLGKLLMLSVAMGCMIGAPMSPSGGARNAIMIGFLSDIGVEVGFGKWMLMGVFYTVVMSVIMAFVLPFLFKPEQLDLSDAVETLKKDISRHGTMTVKQWLVISIMLLVVVMWITDKSLVKSIFGFSMGLGGIAMFGAVLYMLLGFTTWKDYEESVSWGVIVLYAGAISLGTVFRTSGAAGWLADSIINMMEPLGINSGLALILIVVFIGATLTNLMSAGATVAVIGPVVLDMAVNSGTNPLLVGVGLAISTSMAYWLVIGTPASSIVYSSGQLESGDFIRMASLSWPLSLMIMAIMVIIYWAGILNIPVLMQ